MSFSYVVRRILLVFLVIWSAATLNFFIPKITPRNPIREKLLEQASRGGYIPPGFEDMVQSYEKRFGLDQPVWKQYLTYLNEMAHFNLGYSISNFPKTVPELIGQSIWWTIGLLSVTTILTFLIGTLLGALMAWQKSSFVIRNILPGILVLSAVPSFIVGLLLIYFVAFKWKLLPLGGAYDATKLPVFNASFVLEIIRYATLPALAFILTTAGGWAIGMRGMMVTVQGEDYMTFGEAKGLKDWRLFYKYAVRNALLPQVTGLAIAFSYIVGGSVLVEVIFRYPGLGTLLANAIRQLDYFLIYGIVFILTVAIGIAMFIIDMIYPLLDPRIAYEGN
ncbi:MAG: ABC transporter permease [Caldilineaceae bacterium]|nr:ABC transporter permease [Caldilineaceae bacterium]MCB9156429.1 ABC transporter permease [Caldilineaceae bacterium]